DGAAFALAAVLLPRSGGRRPRPAGDRRSQPRRLELPERGDRLVAGAGPQGPDDAAQAQLHPELGRREPHPESAQGARLKSAAGRSPPAGRWGCSVLLLDLDELELHALGPLEEAHAASAGDDGLLEDVNVLGLQLLDQHVELVGVDRDVLHAVMLLALLM